MKQVNFLLVFAIIALVISLVNVIITINKVKTLTGYASFGTANLTVESLASINFTANTVNWGSGIVDTGQTNASLMTNGTVARGNWTAVTNGLVVRNIGNVNVTLSIKSSKTAATFLGGANPTFQWNFTNTIGNTSACDNITDLGLWYDVNTTNPGTGVCCNLSSIHDKNNLRIDIKLEVPYNSLTGDLGAIITATAAAG